MNKKKKYYTSDEIEPYEPVHPGEILKDEIEYRGISIIRLSEATDIPLKTLSDMLNEKRPITAEMSFRICAFLDIDPKLFIKIQSDYDSLTLKRSKPFNLILDKIRQAAKEL